MGAHGTRTNRDRRGSPGCRRRSNYDRMECGGTTPLSTRRHVASNQSADMSAHSKGTRNNFRPNGFYDGSLCRHHSPGRGAGRSARWFQPENGSCRGRHPMKEQKAENEPLTPALSPFGGERERWQCVLPTFRCVRCFPRGRGKLRPGRARSPFQLRFSGSTDALGVAQRQKMQPAMGDRP